MADGNIVGAHMREREYMDRQEARERVRISLAFITTLSRRN
jgi:hypothetical protein